MLKTGDIFQDHGFSYITRPAFENGRCTEPPGGNSDEAVAAAIVIILIVALLTLFINNFVHKSIQGTITLSRFG